MKVFLGVIIFSLMGIVVSANENRLSKLFLDHQWFIVNSEIELSGKNNFNEILSSAVSLSNFDSIQSGSIVVTMINVDQLDFNLATINLATNNDLFNVFINGEEILNELSDGYFHAEITPYAGADNLIIALQAKSIVTAENFKKIIQFSEIDFLQGLVICHFNVKDDTFFGGKLLEIDIRNFFQNDVDGKVNVRLYDQQTNALVTENNNCAFARKSSELIIEVSFPNLDKSSYGKIFRAEIEIVDKENNETIVDALTFPLQFSR